MGCPLGAEGTLWTDGELACSGWMVESEGEVPLYVLMVVTGLNVTVRFGRSARGDVVLGSGRWYWGKSGEVSVVAMVVVALNDRE
jgi:hypothetical protein